MSDSATPTLDSQPAAPSRPPDGEGRRFRWIVNSWVDLLLFVATPLLLIPLMLAARTQFTPQDIALYVTAFGATGHHLPGMLRAYGDRELFARFRLRFILAPIFLLTVCILYAYWDLQGLTLIGVTWGTWHALMQVYGFLRIYDAKVKSFAPLTARLDLLMCFCWFALGLVYSPDRQQHWLELFYRAGGPYLSPEFVRGIHALAIVATGAVTAAFFGNLAWRWQRGERPSPIKLLLLVSSIGLWWYAMVAVNNALLGVALFEIFHDVQYLAIVWVFNQNRAAKSAESGSFTRFLFRRSGAMMGCYVGLVFAYGVVGLLPELIDVDRLRPAFFGLLLASGLLHFYYDGFIWKVRERSTRSGLGLSGGSADAADAPWLPSWAIHGAKWGLFVIPAGWLAASQWHAGTTRLDQLRHVAAATPDSWRAHYLLGAELYRRGRLEEAVVHYRRAANENPHEASLHFDLGMAYEQSGRAALARKHMQTAVDLQPELVAAQAGLAAVLFGMGEDSVAERHAHLALKLEPENDDARLVLGTLLARRSEFSAARKHFERVVQTNPDNAQAHLRLGLVLLRQLEPAEAAARFEATIRLQPGDAEAHYHLGVTRFQQGRLREAIAAYRAALEHEPRMKGAANSLAWNLATSEEDALRDGAEALRLAQALVRESRVPDANFLNTLAAAYAETGQYEQALSAAQQAQSLARQRRQLELAKLIASCLESYYRNRPYRDGRGTEVDSRRR